MNVLQKLESYLNSKKSSVGKVHFYVLAALVSSFAILLFVGRYYWRRRQRVDLLHQKDLLEEQVRLLKTDRNVLRIDTAITAKQDVLDDLERQVQKLDDELTALVDTEQKEITSLDAIRTWKDFDDVTRR